MDPLQELADAIDTLPREYSVKLKPVAERALETQRRRKRISSLIQEALCQIRLDMKYMAFDCDCLRRELKEARGAA